MKNVLAWLCSESVLLYCAIALLGWCPNIVASTIEEGAVFDISEYTGVRSLESNSTGTNIDPAGKATTCQALATLNSPGHNEEILLPFTFRYGIDTDCTNIDFCIAFTLPGSSRSYFQYILSNSKSFYFTSSLYNIIKSNAGVARNPDLRLGTGNSGDTFPNYPQG